ncbi:MAG: leucine-rich repeat domain-containing protein [Prevotellaceae bacterium]|nr:leucine-rich repeat domain-containing protein [Prevotellaceae bacterium]
MKSSMFKLTAVAALLCAATLLSCSGKKASKTVTSQDGTSVELPSDLYLYTNAARANKAKVNKEHLGFKQDVKDVKEHEFENNQSIKEVYLIDGFVHISPYGFAGCTNLEKLVTTGTVDVINDYAFEGCTSLKYLDSDVRAIGVSAFAGCTSLEYVHTKDNFYQLRDSAFLGCTSLKSVIMGMTLVKFEDEAFKDCPNIEEISVPNDYKLHMFNVYQSMPKLQKVYLLVMEYYDFPANSKDFPCEQVDLYVPDALLAQYQGSESWSRFKSIKPLSETEYYTAEGFSK